MPRSPPSPRPPSCRPLAAPPLAAPAPQHDDHHHPTTGGAGPSGAAGTTPLRPALQDIVATCNLAVELDLKAIALGARNAEYNPKRFAAVIMRIREPKTTALIFRSGKMVVTGAKSEEHARNAARKYARIIQKLGFGVHFTDFKVQNIVGSCDVRFPIRLEGLAYKHSHYSSYEPELFPGLIYRMVQPKVVLLIFVSGKVVLTGGKVRNEIYAAFDQIYPVLCEFRKATAAAGAGGGGAGGGGAPPAVADASGGGGDWRR